MSKEHWLFFSRDSFDIRGKKVEREIKIIEKNKKEVLICLVYDYFFKAAILAPPTVRGAFAASTGWGCVLYLLMCLHLKWGRHRVGKDRVCCGKRKLNPHCLFA